MAIRLMIVDDSAVMRETMQQLLAPYPDIQVIGTALDPLLAMQKMNSDWPDVILLDMEMPRMDGLTFLRQIMASRPTPVVICSTLTAQGSATSVQALAAGAVEVIGKPGIGLRSFLQDSAQQLVSAIRTAAKAKVGSPVFTQARPLTDAADLQRLMKPLVCQGKLSTERIVLMGASTGGTQALEYILGQLPANAPPIAIVQHMPEKFTSSFAERLNAICSIEVREAVTGDLLRPGLALVAPGGRHLLIKRDGEQLRAEVKDGPLISRHRPSVDVMFRSAAVTAGSNVMAFLLTGMGADGALGLKELQQAGARTFAQDEASCVVFGMPKEAIKLGAVEQVVALHDIPSVLLSWA
ncbi:chemotaxis response regulator protein-glutamate methylesterase [Ectopseudomonas mendocina]|uniref:Protein-glutamate methylesterase/protein-glutamine glutaminase n=1 Tax=Ectopseudomonas mendocina TaxID=300 RepID=A0ABZ2RIG7_ECTME